MSTPTVSKINFANDFNSGADVYPMIVKPGNGHKIWDGRDHGLKWSIPAGQNKTVHLMNDAHIPASEVVCAGYNVVAGPDRRDEKVTLKVVSEAESNLTAKFKFFGPLYNGSMEYYGTEEKAKAEL